MNEVAQGAVSCFARHPRLKICEGVEIFGGSCRSPSVEAGKIDLFIGFDLGMTFCRRPKVVEILFPIPDRGVPLDLPSFRQLLQFTRSFLERGLSVHAGCVGGHGRTGLFLAALYADITSRHDGIEVVRQGYCSLAVESQEQARWLKENFRCDLQRGQEQP